MIYFAIIFKWNFPSKQKDYRFIQLKQGPLSEWKVVRMAVRRVCFPPWYDYFSLIDIEAIHTVALSTFWFNPKNLEKIDLKELPFIYLIRHLFQIPKFMVTFNQKVHFMSVCRIGIEKRRKPAAAEKWGFLEVGNQLSFQISADFASQRARRTIAKKRKRKRRGFSFFLGEKRT